MSWGVAQLRPTLNAAALAAVNLRRQGFDTFRPTFLERRIKRRKLCIEPCPAFPGYIFIAIPAGARWTGINSTFGNLLLLVRPYAVVGGLYNEPSPISEIFIRGLQYCCWHTGADDVQPAILSAGTVVTVVRGVFAERTALVAWSNSQRVKLLLDDGAHRCFGDALGRRRRRGGGIESGCHCSTCGGIMRTSPADRTPPGRF
jgi:hypothetical protein